ncbi:MAG: hypothetical protein JST68_24120 [Bacteroidetes bacterium]|nr:hypothetical protein [Bacteroidota bacterium]
MTIFLIMISVVACSCSKGGGGNGPAPIDTTETYTTKPPVNGIRIAWDYSTLKKIAPAAGRNANYCGYARITELFDHSLICVYEADGNIECTKSSDAGASWSAPVVVAPAVNGVSSSTADLTELKDHSILVAYNPRPPSSNTDPSKKFGIRTIKSYDGGATWKDDRLLYEASSSFQDGCWEPAPIQLPSGEIQVFFSNEGVYTSSNDQNISIFRSMDNGLTWATSPQIVSYRAGRRDGMPVPVLLSGKSEIAFSIEDNNIGEFKPYIIRTSLAAGWNNGVVDGASSNRNYALTEQLPSTTYAGAPYLRQLKSSETILSYQSTEGRSSNNLNNSRMIVAIGDDGARNFDRRSEPFAITDGRSGLWNSLSVLGDGSVIAITSTNSYASGKTEVWMIKGYVIPEIKPASAENITIDGNLSEPSWQGSFPIFVGSKSTAQTRMAFSYDAQNLYIAAKTKDDDIFTNAANPETGDAVFISTDAKNISSESPTKGIYNFIISADGRLSIKEGSKGAWTSYTGDASQVRKSAARVTGGYNIEAAIPWSLIGGKPAAGQRIGIDAGLINYGSSGAQVSREVVTNNIEAQPYTWCPLFLQ